MGLWRAAGAQRIDTATYATPALAALVADAARDNRVPASLLAYRGNVESEIAVALRRDDGVEMVVGVEQIASTLRWTRTGFYDQHVVGYRARQSAPGASLLSVLRTGWVAPVLYGERLFAPRDLARDSTRRRRRTSGARRERPLIAVHPFARDRDRYYRYTGGDTVVTLRAVTATGERTLPIVRVHVEPRASAARHDQLLFLGDVDVDVVRHVVVRLRGQYVVPTMNVRGVRGRLVRAAIQAYAFVEYENGEREGAFWLPSFQRVEFQGVIAALGDARAIVRIVSRIRDVAVNDTTLPEATTIAAAQWHLTRAPGDTIDHYDGWRAPLGTASGVLHADDFDDVAPDAWRRDGAPRMEPYLARASDLVHFNRIEGLYTGGGARVRFRDALPGVTLRGAGGYAWAEQTARGRVELEKEWVGAHERRAESVAASRWSAGVRVSRSLDLTNDFRSPLDSGSSAAAFIGSIDDNDYVDRRLATLTVRRTLARRVGVIRVETGLARDDAARAHVSRGLTGPDPFRPNRGLDAGRYARTALTVEWHPDVSAEFVRPGVGARLSYERGDGDLRFQRVEARLVSSRDLPLPWPSSLRNSTLTLIGRADGGLLLGTGRPPQQLFELGGGQSLQGYAYKAFAGDRAAMVHTALVYGSPWLRAPIRIGRLFFPGMSPGLSVGLEAGVAEASNDATRLSTLRLGTADGVPLSRPSDGTRATFDAGLRFFGGALFIGAARPIDAHADRSGGWRFVLGAGYAM